MKRTILSMVVLSGLICTSVLGEDVKISKDVKDFDVIKISCYAKVYLKQGDTESLSLEGSKSAINDIIVEKSSNVLEIKRKENDMSFFEKLFDFSTYTSEQITINISVKNIKKMSNSGWIELQITSPLKSDNLFLDCSGKMSLKSNGNIVVSDELILHTSGSSNVELKDVNAKTIDFEASGSSDVSIQNVTAKSVKIDSSGSFDLKISGGSAEQTEIETSGSTDCDLIGMESKDVKISTSGSGKVKICATESLKIDSSGSCKISYKGNPKSIINESSGSSRITQSEK